MEKAKKYFTFFCLLTVLIISGCSEDNPLIPPAEDHSPMWPMAGYNARHTGNPNSIKVNIQPVVFGRINWVDTLSSIATSFNDASENCIDALGNIYHYSNRHDSSVLIKLRSDGTTIWEKDSVELDANGGFALTDDEKNIFFHDYYKIGCIDSSGKMKWALPSEGYVAIPVIGRDKNIYFIINHKLTSVTPEGNILWQIPNETFFGWPAIDKEDNLYVFNNKSNHELVKVNKTGNILWRYSNLGSRYNYNSIVIDGFNNIYINSKDSLITLNKFGQFRWAKYLYSADITSAITSDNKIITDSAGKIMALDTAGNVLWRSNNAMRIIESAIMLDGIDNSYFIYSMGDYFSASFDINGNLRWNCQLPGYWGGYPCPTLSPNGTIFCTPKRPYLRYTVK